MRTGQRRAVNVWPDNGDGHGRPKLRYRFQWNFPIVSSRRTIRTRIYITAANVLFSFTRTTGRFWRQS